MGKAIYTIDAFPDEDLFWCIERIGGIRYNMSVPSDPLIEICFPQLPIGETNPLSITRVCHSQIIWWLESHLFSGLTGPQQVLFVPDTLTELEAAQAMGMLVALSLRSGGGVANSTGFAVIHSLEEILPA